MKRFITTLCLVAALSGVSTFSYAEKNKTLLDIKSDITDSNIIFPESYEVDTRKMLEGWYMKNYTATDDRYRSQHDVQTGDDTFRSRLAGLPTVIEMPYNSIVRSYIERYTERGRDQVAALLGLSIYYMPIFEQALEENGLPLELKYLPIVESGLDPNAVSKHGATGLWQFMIGTAKGLGLEVSSIVDERRDPYLSSRTAAKYLKDLYDSYGDWSLAIAAYNCGPGAVNKAIRRAGGDPKTHDFWSIYYYLTPETRGYVPMFIATNYIMNFHKEHNISPVLPTKPLVIDTVMVDTRIHFDQISKILDIPVEELQILNPQFRANIIPGTPEHAYTLILPSQQCNAYIMSEEEILAYEADKYSRRIDAEPGHQPSTYALSEVSDETDQFLADDTVPDGSQSNPDAAGRRAYREARESADSAPAARSRNSDRAPKTSNWADNSSNKNARADRQSDRQSKGKSGTSGKKKSQDAAKSGTHSVKNGENLYVIAKRYGVSVNDLKKANNLKSDALQPGDKLKVPGKSGSSKSGVSKSGSSSKSKGSKGKSSKGGKKKRRR